jgi:DNA polymerase-3 subunit epsilon
MTAWRRWLRRRVPTAPRSAGGRWVVVDTETTGLAARRDRLLAVGGVAVDDAGIRLDDSFEIVVRNEPAGDSADVLVHGIGHGAQRAGVPARDALGSYLRWVGDAPRVGFHADFDRAVLDRALAAAGLAADAGPWLDLAPLAAALAPDARRHSLDEWLVACGIECTTRHNASADACATAQLLLYLKAKAAAQGAVGFDALLRLARQRKWLAAGP